LNHVLRTSPYAFSSRYPDSAGHSHVPTASAVVTVCASSSLCSCQRPEPLRSAASPKQTT